MLAIIRREWKGHLKNPLFYLGIILVGWTMYSSLQGYLFTYLDEDMQIEEKSPYEADVMDGYIPYTEEEKQKQYNEEFEHIRVALASDYFGYSETEAEEIVTYLKESGMTIKEMGEYMEEKYDFPNAELGFIPPDTKKVTVAEANEYMKQALDEHTFTYYFSLKYADLLTVEMLIFCIVLFVFSFMFESKQDIYELLHTKPLKSGAYVWGKVLGNMSVSVFVIIVITAVMNICVVQHCIKENLAYSIWDMWMRLGLFLLPSLFVIIATYFFVSVLFKNAIPAVPVLILYMIYSNMGRVEADGSFSYHLRPLSLCIRCPEVFFENTIYDAMFINQAAIILLGIVLCLVANKIWNRRRV